MVRGVLVAVALVLLAVPGSAQALTRAQAQRIAVAKLRPPKGALLHVLALKRGATVVEAGPGPRTRVRRRGDQLIVRSRFKPVTGRTWLVWEDLVPGALFAHPSVLLLIDDRTGRVARRQPMSFIPLVNGRRPAFLKAGTRASAAAVPPNLSIDCMVTIGDRTDPLFAGDFKLAGQVAAALKLASYDATSVSDLAAQIRRAEARGCKDVMLVIAAHGLPARGSNYTHPSTGEAITESDHAQVQLGYTVKDRFDEPEVTAETLDAAALREIMSSYPALTFKLVVSSCFSGRWLELADVANLRVIAVSSRRDQFSFGAFEPGKHPRFSQANATLTATGGTVANTTTNHTQATAFMNGLLRGLDAWAHTDGRPSDDLAKGIVDAFGRERTQDFATQVGWANPQLSDHTGGAAPAPIVSPAPQQTNLPPSASLRLSTTTVKVGEPVRFDAVAADPDGSIVKVRLVFGDGTSYESTEAPQGVTDQHAYTGPGIYEASFEVTDDDGARVMTDVQRVFVSGPGTKDAAIDDAPCPGTFDVVVDINIPSYAANPTASFSGTPCVGASVTILSATGVGLNAAVLDAWGQPETIYRVTLRVTGGTSTGSLLTVTAHWQ